MLRLATLGFEDGAGVETGAAEGELEEPPQDETSSEVRRMERARLGCVAKE
jgi:hypothetical protein